MAEHPPRALKKKEIFPDTEVPEISPAYERAANDNFIDSITQAANDNEEDFVPSVEGSKSKAEQLASLRSMISEYESRIKNDPNVRFDPENSHDALHQKISDTEQTIRNVERTAFEPVRFTKSQLDDVRDRLNISKPENAPSETVPHPQTTEAAHEFKPLKTTYGIHLEAIDSKDLKELSSAEVASRADARYLEKYKEVYARKNESIIPGAPRKGAAELAAIEKTMLSARAKALQEQEQSIADPAERARFRRESALSLMQLKQQSRIEAMSQEGRWDQKLYDNTLKKFGAWNKGLEEKHGKWKVRALRAAITTLAVTGTGAAFLAFAPSASVGAFAVLGGMGVYRFARSFAGGAIGNQLGKLYKNTIGEKQRSKSEKRLQKLDVHGDLDEDTYTDFMKRFEKNYIRSDKATLQKKMTWVGIAGAAAIGAGASAGIAAELHDLVPQGTHGGGGSGTGTGGTPPGGHAAVTPHGGGAHGALAKGPESSASAKAPQAPVTYTPESIRIGDTVDGVKINDMDKALGHFAMKLQKDYPDMTKAPSSVRTFMGLFNTKDGPSILGNEDHAARALGLEDKGGLSLLVRDGTTLNFNDQGQIVLEFAKHGKDIQPPHVLIDADSDGAVNFDLDDLQKYMRMPHGHGETAVDHAETARSAKEAGAAPASPAPHEQPHRTGTPEANPADQAYPLDAKTIEDMALANEREASTVRLTTEYENLRAMHQEWPRNADIYHAKLAEYTAHLTEFNEKFPDHAVATEAMRATPVIHTEHGAPTPRPSVETGSIEPFTNAYNIKIVPDEVHIYTDRAGHSVAYGSTFEARYAVAEAYVKAHKNSIVLFDSSHLDRTTNEMIKTMGALSSDTTGAITQIPGSLTDTAGNPLPLPDPEKFTKKIL